MHNGPTVETQRQVVVPTPGTHGADYDNHHVCIFLPKTSLQHYVLQAILPV